MTFNKTTVLLSIGLLSGCGFDPAAEQYDQVRYEELQKANCNEVASLSTRGFVVESDEDFDVVLARCKKLKSLTLEQYIIAAKRSRETGEWQLDEFE